MKKLFEVELEVIFFGVEDVLTASLVDLDDPNNYTKVEFPG